MRSITRSSPAIAPPPAQTAGRWRPIAKASGLEAARSQARVDILAEMTDLPLRLVQPVARVHLAARPSRTESRRLPVVPGSLPLFDFFRWDASCSPIIAG